MFANLPANQSSSNDVSWLPMPTRTIRPRPMELIVLPSTARPQVSARMRRLIVAPLSHKKRQQGRIVVLHTCDRCLRHSLNHGANHCASNPSTLCVLERGGWRLPGGPPRARASCDFGHFEPFKYFIVALAIYRKMGEGRHRFLVKVP
jgi:hypothetical protein